MKLSDKGVIEPSFMEFSLPSAFAKQALYYTPQFGHFYCNRDYRISRTYLDSLLLMYICHGALFTETRGHRLTVGSGQIVLLDCRNPHIYGCPDHADFLWFHFNGCSSDAYIQYLDENFGLLFTGPSIRQLQDDFDAILTLGQGTVINEHAVSSHISHILSILATPSESSFLIHHALAPALTYISQNFDHSIDLERLASLCSISPSYLIRCFKKYLNCTPHEYLLLFRLRQSKRLLLTSSSTIEEIAEQCGFNSPSHFARAFKKDNCMSPSEFRHMQF